jgi:ribose 5-phosphate isomerase
LREKILQERIHAGSKIIIVVEDYKLTKKVGVAHPVPVEVIPFSHENTRRGNI